MKNISISTGVFSLIWALRQDGEETENDILERILLGEKADGKHQNMERKNPQEGFIDSRNGVRFPEGFEIFRNYKGQNYAATATKGCWKLKNTNKNYRTLNQLSQSIIEGNENAWISWNYKNEKGYTTKLIEYRNQQIHMRRYKLFPSD